MGFPGYKSLGIRLDQVLTAAQVAETTLGKEPSLGHVLGLRVSDDVGNEFVWVQAQGAIAAGIVVAIAADYDVPPAGAAGQAWAVSTVAIADDGQGFVQVKGVVADAPAEANVTAGAPLARLLDGSADLIAIADVQADADEPAGSFDTFAVAMADDTATRAPIYIY